MDIKRRIQLMAALVLLVTILVITGCGESSAQSPQIGKLSPGFTLYDLGDEAVSLSELKGKPVFINFWASWCGPCQEEMPLIQSIYERQAGQPQPAVILTINIGQVTSQIDPGQINYLSSRPRARVVGPRNLVLGTICFSE